MIKTLSDKDGKIKAKIKVKTVNMNLFSGEIISHSFSETQIKILMEYENLVNNQVFSLLDHREEKIESWGLKLKEENRRIFDVQIWNLKEISFRIVK